MRDIPQALMLFAAGRGTRMGALTENHPKPLIPVAGRALIDHALALADAARISRIAVNLHYLPDQIEAHLAARPGIAFSRETDLLLETGGGLRAALPLLGPGPVFTLNSDAVWTGANPLTELRTAWNADRMQALLLLAPLKQATGHAGAGDFAMDEGGRLTRAKGPDSLVYIGAQITRTEGLAAIPDPVFSLNRLWDRMIAEGALFGTIHQGGWCDVGTPEGVRLAEALLKVRT
jgi:N-acetyl-alpha-D-muramate 1-phosphate uridylyltransferase